ncbi:MAG TPA: hydroxymethylpyrimidine/phosphomethylpyrimidine kinase [Bacteroidales bacterium]|nr:hydroxymethylpyrimidine/phosphomethylpyrimidine kinase [Bacteroidales bacterium]
MDYFLTIAASDNSGGAGIQQDIKVAYNLGYWPLSAITGITVQNFNKVFKVEAVQTSLLKFQIEQCFLSFPVKTVKIGAICSHDNLLAIVDCLKQFSQKHVILDPVLFSTGGVPFLDKSSLKVLQQALFPLTDLITPNKLEFEILTNQKINKIEEAIEIAIEKCKEWNTSVLLKGGHFSDKLLKEALITPTDVYHFQRKRKKFSYSHGTGCTLSTALACYIGKNKSLYDSYLLSSKYLIGFYDKLHNPQVMDETN